MKKDIKLSTEQIKALEKALSEDKRVEITPHKDEIKMFIVQRKEIRSE